MHDEPERIDGGADQPEADEVRHELGGVAAEAERSQQAPEAAAGTEVPIDQRQQQATTKMVSSSGSAAKRPVRNMRPILLISFLRRSAGIPRVRGKRRQRSGRRQGPVSVGRARPLGVTAGPFRSCGAPPAACRSSFLRADGASGRCDRRFRACVLRPQASCVSLLLRICNRSQSAASDSIRSARGNVAGVRRGLWRSRRQIGRPALRSGSLYSIGRNRWLLSTGDDWRIFHTFRWRRFPRSASGLVRGGSRHTKDPS